MPTFSTDNILLEYNRMNVQPFNNYIKNDNDYKNGYNLLFYVILMHFMLQKQLMWVEKNVQII